MTIDTSKETGYAVQSSLPDGIVVTKEVGYAVLREAPPNIGKITFSGFISATGGIRIVPASA